MSLAPSRWLLMLTAMFLAMLLIEAASLPDGSDAFDIPGVPCDLGRYRWQLVDSDSSACSASEWAFKREPLGMRAEEAGCSNRSGPAEVMWGNVLIKISTAHQEAEFTVLTSERCTDIGVLRYALGRTTPNGELLLKRLGPQP